MVKTVNREFVDRRAAQRTSLVMRAAKLISLEGEYVCIVRDVSRTGVKLKLFHDAPPGEFVFLELANGEVYPMQRVWQRDDHAGFRFTSEIDIDRFIKEPGHPARRHIRLRVRWPATVSITGRDFRGCVLNWSQQGACIDIEGQIPVRHAIWFEMSGVPRRFGHVCWRKGNRHGLVFQDATPLDTFARHAVVLQPFTTEIPPVGDEARRRA